MWALYCQILGVSFCVDVWKQLCLLSLLCVVGIVLFLVLYPPFGHVSFFGRAVSVDRLVICTVHFIKIIV